MREFMLAKETILQPQFVRTDYFLCRVKEFEKRYDKNWGEFYVEFSSGKGRENPDFIEWAFLCRTFMRELIEQESPPGEILEIVEKPESNSGFFVGANNCSILKNILIKSKGGWRAARA